MHKRFLNLIWCWWELWKSRGLLLFDRVCRETDPSTSDASGRCRATAESSNEGILPPTTGRSNCWVDCSWNRLTKTWFVSSRNKSKSALLKHFSTQLIIISLESQTSRCEDLASKFKSSNKPLNWSQPISMWFGSSVNVESFRHPARSRTWKGAFEWLNE